MSARDDFGSDAGRPGGRGGSNGGLANGGVGGGRGGGGGGGGAGRNGGYGSNTGLQTGNKMYGNSAYGRPGGRAMNLGAWGLRPGPSVQQSALNRPAIPAGVVPQPAAYQPGLSYTYQTDLYAGLYPGNYWGGALGGLFKPTMNGPAAYNNTQLQPGYGSGNYWGGTLGGFNKPNNYNDYGNGPQYDPMGGGRPPGPNSGAPAGGGGW